MNPTAYFSELLDLRAMQGQIVSDTRQALDRDSRKMADALGVKISAAVAKRDIGPGSLTRKAGEHAWVGIYLPLGKEWFFGLGSYFEVSDTASEPNDLYVYGGVGLPDAHDPDVLCGAIRVSFPWVMESSRKDWSVEMFPDKPLVDLSEYSLHLGRVIGEWCRIWSSLGGLEGMIRKSRRSE